MICVPFSNPETPPRGPVAQLARILAGTGKALFLLGAVVAVGGCVWSKVGAADPGPVEFPLGEVRDVATDSQGHIYVAEGFYARVQRYSADGEFEVGWPVPTAGFFALRTTSDGQLQVATARGNKLLTYTADGQLVSEGTHDGRLAQEFAAETETTGGLATRGGLLPHVIDTRSGETVVSTPWAKRLLAAPFPAAGYTVLGLALVALSELLRRSRRVRPT